MRSATSDSASKLLNPGAEFAQIEGNEGTKIPTAFGRTQMGRVVVAPGVPRVYDLCPVWIGLDSVPTVVIPAPGTPSGPVAERPEGLCAEGCEEPAGRLDSGGIGSKSSRHLAPSSGTAPNFCNTHGTTQGEPHPINREVVARSAVRQLTPQRGTPSPSGEPISQD
jgi:hypothetical protein